MKVSDSAINVICTTQCTCDMCTVWFVASLNCINTRGMT